MTAVRRVAALLTLALSLETTLLGSAVACLMPGDDDAAAMAGMDMAGMDMTPAQPQPGDDTHSDGEPPCSFPWSPPGDCHDMQACAPMAIAPPAVTVTLVTPMLGAVLPRALAGPRSLAHTPDPPPPRA
jgi:hypothetical protein